MKSKRLVNRKEPVVSARALGRFMRDNKLLVLCSGEFEEDDNSLHLETVEKRLSNLISEKKLKKRIFFIVVESIQNITRHGLTKEVDGKSLPSLMAMGREKEFPYVLTSNPILNKNVDDLKKKIDAVNKMDEKSLRKAYRQTLAEGEMNSAGGAGLGLIEIARKAGGALEYNFEPIDDHASYFTMKVNLLAA